MKSIADRDLASELDLSSSGVQNSAQMRLNGQCLRLSFLFLEHFFLYILSCSRFRQ